MIITTRKYLMTFLIISVAALYATAAWRVEQARNQPRTDISCSTTLCIPHSGTFNALR
ncbi:hypothetical protein [Pseudomonas sp. RIT-To-2]|uniref:hypothetical protein n=1 Tax=Pseudomonas sp. RIT-To-2 TaxID=3462541 RepID=UPI002412E9E6